MRDRRSPSDRNSPRQPRAGPQLGAAGVRAGPSRASEPAAIGCRRSAALPAADECQTRIRRQQRWPRSRTAVVHPRCLAEVYMQRCDCEEHACDEARVRSAQHPTEQTRRTGCDCTCERRRETQHEFVVAELHPVVQQHEIRRVVMGCDRVWNDLANRQLGALPAEAFIEPKRLASQSLSAQI